MAILLQAVQIWKTSHDGQPPQSSKDRSEFRAILQSMRRREDSKGGALEVAGTGTATCLWAYGGLL